MINGSISSKKPEKKYQNPEDVFRKESRNEFKKNHSNIGSAQKAQRESWAAMSDKQKEKYAKIYEDSVKEYENNLANQKQIPPRPKDGLNSFFIFLKEQRENYFKQHKGKLLKKMSKGLSKIYNSLTEEQKLLYKQEAKRQKEVQSKEIEKWEELYGEQFQEEFNDGSKNDASGQNQIPPRPKDGLNSFFIFLKEQRENYFKQHKGKLLKKMSKGLSKIYNSLTEEQKLPYEQEAKRQQEVQNKEIEKWEELYGEQFKEEQKKLKEEHKYSAKKSRKELTYQEILSHKKRRSLVPLGDEETKQNEERVGGRPRKLSTQREENQRESVRPSSEKLKQEQGRVKMEKPQEEHHRRSISRSPLENPIVQFDQKNQKFLGRGRPKKQSQ